VPATTPSGPAMCPPQGGSPSGGVTPSAPFTMCCVP
jgi:hypothetical protein